MSVYIHIYEKNKTGYLAIRLGWVFYRTPCNADIRMKS